MTLNIDELSTMDATAQAELVRRRELTPLELVDAAIARIERLNPTLNAVIHKHFERARTQAAGELPEGPFRGVPFLLKDFGAATLKGDPNNYGTRFLRDADYRASTTSYLVEKFLKAGLIIVGRTNTPELPSWTTTEPPAYGPTRNPWVASTKRTARPARKKYVPSAKQCAEDQRLKENLDHLSKDDLIEFDKALEKAIKSA